MLCQTKTFKLRLHAAQSWLVSLTAHLLAAILAVWIIPSSQLVADLASDRSEIVLLPANDDSPVTFTSEAAALSYEPTPVEANPTIAVALTADMGLPWQVEPRMMTGIGLPSPPAMPLAVDLSPRGKTVSPASGAAFSRPWFSNPADDAFILANDAVRRRPPPHTGPTAELSLFGSKPAIGRSFVFVIDRSASMADLGAMQAAAAELAARIVALSAEQTFQVIAYNETVIHLAGGQLIPATPENKQQLVKFIAETAAYGPTEHIRGLLAALRLKPEVIFLLTDGGDPLLDPGQLRLIREQAAGQTSIHCVRFGHALQNDLEDSLSRLAAENRGSCVDVDLAAR